MYAIAYFAITAELGVPEARRILARIQSPRRGRG
jgi:hypothetical protein